jgi:hypothetical protein
MQRMPRQPSKTYRSRIIHALLALGAAGCQSSAPDATTGLRIATTWSGPIDQLEYAVTTASGAVHAPERRPSVAQGPLASDADVVIYLSDQMGGQHVRCAVTGYYQGARMASAEAQADVVAGQVVDVHVALGSTGPGPDGGTGEGGATGGAGGAGGAGGSVGSPDGGPGGKGNGQSCNGASQCTSGFCADGVCCDGACGGTCQACNIPGRLGTCSPTPAGTRENMCPQEAVKTCGQDGTCDGAGACRKYPAGTMCMPGTCAGNSVSGAGACDGRGSCQAGASVSCGAYACEGGSGTCKTACSSNGDCTSPNSCAGGKCGLWKALGQACGAGPECSSGHCVDGACCSTPSCGACFTCNLLGAAGSCKPVLAGMPEPHGLCSIQPVATCGLDGMCNGSGGCASYPSGTLCRMTRTCQNGACR